MLKRIFMALAIALPMLVSAQTIKIGVVDSETLFTSHPDFKVAQQKVANVSKRYEDEYAKLREAYNTKVEELKKLEQAKTESQSVLDHKASDIKNLGTRIQSFEQEAQQAMQREQESQLQPLQQKVIDAIDAVAKEHGFSVVQEKAALIYYAAPVEDITPLVKKKLGIL